jgi:hypothetical protein
VPYTAFTFRCRFLASPGAPLYSQPSDRRPAREGLPAHLSERGRTPRSRRSRPAIPTSTRELPSKPVRAPRLPGQAARRWAVLRRRALLRQASLALGHGKLDCGPHPPRRFASRGRLIRCPSRGTSASRPWRGRAGMAYWGILGNAAPPGWGRRRAFVMAVWPTRSEAAGGCP